jgi:hypothetical protein
MISTFEVLDALEEAGCLNQTRCAKSVTLTKARLEHARALEASFLGNGVEGPSIRRHARP